MVDAICFGELLIDFVSLDRGVSVGQASGFTKAAGGAPANVAVGLAKLGVHTAFMGQVGDDFFGHALAEVVASTGVDISALRYSQSAMTALAFVAVDDRGERSFVFYRKPSADMLMTPDDLDHTMLSQTKLFHYGSITLIDDPVKTTTLKAIELAQAGGALISYDPNLRAPLWPDLEAAKAGMQLGFAYANVVKMSEEELIFLTGESDLAQGVKNLWTDNTQLVVITKGEHGSEAFTNTNHWIVEGFQVAVEDTIGAGDGFVAGLLSGLMSIGSDWAKADLRPILRRANAVGALTATKQGGIPALPTEAEVTTFLASH